MGVNQSNALSTYALIEINELLIKLEKRVIYELKFAGKKNNKIIPRITTITDKNGLSITTPISPSLWRSYERLIYQR